MASFCFLKATLGLRKDNKWCQAMLKHLKCGTGHLQSLWAQVLQKGLCSKQPEGCDLNANTA